MKEDFDFDEIAPWLVAFVTLAGGLLRVLLLGVKGMWLDETVSVWLAANSVPGVLHWTAQIDLQPPLYYLLLHFWTRIVGDAPYYTRLLSVLFGTATIPIIYLIGKRMGGSGIGVAAAALLAVSPLNVRLAQETGMWTLVTFNASIAIYALVRLLSDPRAATPLGRQLRDYARHWRTAAPPAEPVVRQEFSYRPDPRDLPGWRGWLARSPLLARHRFAPVTTVATDLAWLTFILFSAATLLTHSAAVLFLLAANVFVLGLMLYGKIRGPRPAPAFRAPSLANWLVAQAAVLLLWSPWLPAFIRQAAAVYRDFWLPPPNWDAVRELLGSLVNASMPVRGVAVDPGLLLIPFALVAALAGFAYRKKPSHFFFLVCLFAVPILAELLISLRRPILSDRTLIWISIPLLLALAAGITQLRFRPLIVVALMLLASINLFSVGDYFRFSPRETWKDAAGFVSLFAEQDDLILFSPPRAQFPFDYYFRDFEARYGARLEKRGVPVDALAGGPVEPQVTEPDAAGLSELLRARDRVWLIYSAPGYADPQGLVPQTISRDLKLAKRQNFLGGQVQLYERP